jgi:hypothetical protein
VDAKSSAIQESDGFASGAAEETNIAGGLAVVVLED